MEEKATQNEPQDIQKLNQKQPDAVEITKKSVALTVRQIFGNDAQVLWSMGLYKRDLILKIILSNETGDYNFIIDSNHVAKPWKLQYIAKTLVTMHARAKAMLMHEMAVYVAEQNKPQNDPVQAEKDRMAGRQGDGDIRTEES